MGTKTAAMKLAETLKDWLEGAKSIAFFAGILILPLLGISMLPISCQIALGFKNAEDIPIDGMKDIIRHNIFEQPESAEAIRFMDCWAHIVKDRATNTQKAVYADFYKALKRGNMAEMDELEKRAEKAELPELTAKAYKICI